jgi:hypothetical protein
LRFLWPQALEQKRLFVLKYSEAIQENPQGGEFACQLPSITDM